MHIEKRWFLIGGAGLLLICAAALILMLRSPENQTMPSSPTTGTTQVATTIPPTGATIPSTSITVPSEPTGPSIPVTVPPTVPPVTTVPPTTIAPTAPAEEYIGKLYTRAYLESLDSTLKGYGPGTHVDNRNRPTISTSLTEQFKHLDAHFIAPDDGNIYLSFNCGYEYNNLTTVVLDALKARNVKAVFFVNHHFASANPDLIRRIIDEGHILANHCTRHPDLPRLPIDSIVQEIMTTHNYILDTYGYEMKLFRPPSGYYSEQVLAIAQSLGYRTYNFSFAYRDWETENLPDPAETLDMMIAKAHSGAIYQLHTTSGTNAAIIGSFIDAMVAQGYTFALLP